MFYCHYQLLFSNNYSLLRIFLLDEVSDLFDAFFTYYELIQIYLFL